MRARRPRRRRTVEASRSLATRQPEHRAQAASGGDWPGRRAGPPRGSAHGPYDAGAARRAPRIKFCGITSPRRRPARGSTPARGRSGCILWPRLSARVRPRARPRASRPRCAARPRSPACSSTRRSTRCPRWPTAIGLTMVQLHGDEGPAFCAEVARRTGAKVIKAAPVAARPTSARSRPSTPTSTCSTPTAPGCAAAPARRSTGSSLRTRRSGPADPQRRAARRQRRRGDRRRGAVRGRRRQRAPRPRPGVKDPESCCLRRGGARRPPSSAGARVSAVEHRFGPYGGQYVPETLMPALAELEAAWVEGVGRPGVPRASSTGCCATTSGARRRCTSPAPERGRRPRGLPQARGPQPHRRAQDQQRARPGAAGQAHGQAADHRRDRRRPARRRHGDRVRAARPRVRRLHGRRGHRAARSPTSSAWSCSARRVGPSRRARGR